MLPILQLVCIGLITTFASAATEVVNRHFEESVTLYCSAKLYDGVPYYIEWFKGRVAIFSKLSSYDEFIHPAFQGRVELVDHSPHLKFTSLQTGDGGNYTCVMNLIDGAAYVYEQSTILNVLEAPSFIYSPPAYTTGKRGSTIFLRCTASGTPPPTLTWYKDGVLIETTNRISLTDNDLQIENLQDSDVGRYKCKFTNFYGYVTSTTVLVLEGGALITERPRNQTVSSGQSVTFLCSGRASPNNITYTWYKDGTNVNSVRTLRGKTTINSDGSLTITSVGENDSAVYRCTISNGLGAPMSAEAHLSVIFTPLVDADQWQSNVNIPIGRTGELPCPVKGYPPVTHVVWAITRRTLDIGSPRLELTEDFSLLIHNVTFNDSGWYTCTPYNDNGPGVQSNLMTVAALDPPQFIKQPEQEYSVNIDESITIPCAANSSRVHKVTITWEKLYSPMPESSRLTLHPEGSITISGAQKEDGGTYTCVATDGDISSTVSTDLIIHNTTPHAPINVTALFRHYDIQVSWIPGFDGGYQQSYAVLFRESRRSEGNWQQLPDQEQTTYTIYGLTPDTRYELKILSKNKLGDGGQSEVVAGSTLGYTPGALQTLPTNAAGLVMFPSIVKPIGPEPGAPENVSVVHDDSGGAIISWQEPAETAVPVLYYKLEYRNESRTEWQLDSPVLSNQTSTTFVPTKIEEDVVVKYYFRVRAYGLLSYSEYSEAVIIFFPKEPEVEELTLAAKVGIGIGAVFVFGLLIAVLVILCDLKPRKVKNKPVEVKSGRGSHYSLAPQTSNRASEWQSFYPYHGGRFAINGEVDNIYVIDNQRDNNVLTHSSTERDDSVVRHEQGWYFPRDGHPELDLTRTYDSNSTDKPPPHGVGYTANYSSYNGLLHGYYDARTGTQISPSVVNYPHSGVEAGDTTDGNTSNDNTARHRTQSAHNAKDRLKLNLAYTGNESQPIYANHAMTFHGASNSNWFTPHYNTHNEQHASTLSPISLSYDREQEIVLKPSLPRHSSMRPSIQVPADDEDEAPFDPHLSMIRENSISAAVDPAGYDSRDSDEYPYTNGWVESQSKANTYNNRHLHHPLSNTLHQRAYDNSSRARGYHTLASNDLATHSPYTQRPVRHVLERGSSVGSSVNEMRAHYNRDRLLGTVERVRSTSSRSRRAGSIASQSSGQLSPQLNGYVHSPLPPPYQLTECYPELVSPVYYNNNNNRQSESAHSQGNQSFRSSNRFMSSPHYENSGLLKSTQRRPPAFNSQETPDHSRLVASAVNTTSGLGSSLSQSHIDGHQRRPRPSWSRSSAQTPYEYDISCESSPAVVLPQFSNGGSRYFGLYAKPKYTSPHTSQHTPQSWSSRNPNTSYDPSFFTSSYNAYQYRPKEPTPHRAYKPPTQAPSDSVDENYEFDPILIDSEPQDFFHVQNENLPEADDESSPALHRPSLYAEQQTPPATSTSQRFSRLRNEFNTYRERQHSLTNRMALNRLESEIL